MGGEITGKWNTTNRLPRNTGHFSSDTTTTRDEIEGETSTGSSADSVFWSVPTLIEVQNALAALHSFMQGLSSSRLATDQHQPMWSHVRVDLRILNSPGYQRVYDAYQLLRTVPSVQRMVTSISSDRAVWDAVLSNKQVQEFQHSVHQARLSGGAQGPNKEEGPDLVSMILRWILDNMRLKLVELIDALRSVVSNSNFGSPRNNTTTQNNHPRLKQQLEEMICSTVLLSVITLMIVLVTRAYGSS